MDRIESIEWLQTLRENIKKELKQVQDKVLAFTLHGEHNVYYDDFTNYETFQYIVATSDIEDVVMLGDDQYLKFPELLATEKNRDAINNLLKNTNIEEAMEIAEEKYTVEMANDYETAEDIIAWHPASGAFFLVACDTYRMYEYWDGSNWQQTFIDDDDTTDITVDDIYEDLDSYDQNGNKYFGRQWEHGKLYKILTIDGDEASDAWLLYISSQWQGSKNRALMIDSKRRAELIR